MLGDGTVGKTALAVQVRAYPLSQKHLGLQINAFYLVHPQLLRG